MGDSIKLESVFDNHNSSQKKESPMTPLRQRFIEDMLLRGFAPGTQRSYIHYVEGFAKFYNKSPALLDLEAIRQYELYLLEERKLSPASINTFVS